MCNLLNNPNIQHMSGIHLILYILQYLIHISYSHMFVPRTMLRHSSDRVIVIGNSFPHVTRSAAGLLSVSVMFYICRCPRSTGCMHPMIDNSDQVRSERQINSCRCSSGDIRTNVLWCPKLKLI